MTPTDTASQLNIHRTSGAASRIARMHHRPTSIFIKYIQYLIGPPNVSCNRVKARMMT
jgi:hypothetical protein